MNPKSAFMFGLGSLIGFMVTILVMTNHWVYFLGLGNIFSVYAYLLHEIE